MALRIGLQVNWLEGDPGIVNVTVSNNIIRNLGTPAISVDPSVPASAVVLENNTKVTRPRVAETGDSDPAVDKHGVSTPRVAVDWPSFLARSDPVNRFDAPSAGSTTRSARITAAKERHGDLDELVQGRS